MANSKISALTSATTPLAGTETLPVVQSSTTKQVSIANVTAGRAVSALSYSGTATSDLTFAAFTSGAKGWQINGSASAVNLYITGTSYSFNSIGASQAWLWNFNSALNIGSDGSFETRIVVGGSAVLRAQTTGDVKIDTGNLVIGTAGKGIDFSANSHAAGMTSELLTWYEEGTWTPAIDSATAGSGRTTTVYSATYTRIGRQVSVQAYMKITTLGTGGSGAWVITGLPFTSAGSNAYGTANIGYAATLLATVGNLGGYIYPSSTRITITGSTGASTLPYGELTFATYVTTNTELVISATYFV